MLVFPHVFSSVCCHFFSFFFLNYYIFCLFIYCACKHTRAPMNGIVGMWGSEDSLQKSVLFYMRVRGQAWLSRFCSKSFTSWDLLLASGFCSLKLHAESYLCLWLTCSCRDCLCFEVFTMQKLFIFMDSHLSGFELLLGYWSPSQKVLAYACVLKYFL